jgi:hypothetical protein
VLHSVSFSRHGVTFRDRVSRGQAIRRSPTGQPVARVGLTTDNVLGDDGGVHELGAMTGDVTSGCTVSLTAAPVGTTTTPSAGSGPAGGPGGPPPSR